MKYNTKKCVSLTISYHQYFLRISKDWSMLHHGSVGRVQSKEGYFMFTWAFFGIFLFFFIKKMFFISFSFVFVMKYQISAKEY